MNIPPAVWGPFFWNTLHLVALGYSANPTYVEKRAAKEFYESLTKLIPCPICREHYTAHLKEMPISSSLDNRKDLFTWTVKLHNKVNVMLGKPERTEVEILNYYKTLGERGRSPIWGLDDLSEVNMRSYLRGLATASVIACGVGAVLYYMK